MFSVLKCKLQSVQDNLTTSFRGLKVTDPALPNTAKTFPVDLNAGGDVLHKYQSEWQEMHKLAEENALAAEKVDTKIGKLFYDTQKQWQAATQFSTALGTLPSLCSKMGDIVTQIENLQSLIITVENSLLELADTVERKELQEKQLERKFQLAIHSEQRLAQLDSLRATLSEEHRQKVTHYEKEFEKKQKERQETFGRAFEEDLEMYKQTGVVPTIRPPMTSGPSLEEVELDVDREALDHMLDE